jgi:hypothetical protein
VPVLQFTEVGATSAGEQAASSAPPAAKENPQSRANTRPSIFIIVGLLAKGNNGVQER